MYTYLKPEEDGLLARPSGLWANEKLDYLARYIDVFETSMRGHWSARNYIDLLAGPGKNQMRETGTFTLGSPLLALTTRYPFTGSIPSPKWR
jgi:three-Cys-motif partner protein